MTPPPAPRDGPPVPPPGGSSPARRSPEPRSFSSPSASSGASCDTRSCFRSGWTRPPSPSTSWTRAIGPRSSGPTTSRSHPRSSSSSRRPRSSSSARRSSRCGSCPSSRASPLFLFARLARQILEPLPAALATGSPRGLLLPGPLRRGSEALLDRPLCRGPAPHPDRGTARGRGAAPAPRASSRRGPRRRRNLLPGGFRPRGDRLRPPPADLEKPVQAREGALFRDGPRRDRRVPRLLSSRRARTIPRAKRIRRTSTGGTVPAPRAALTRGLVRPRPCERPPRVPPRTGGRHEHARLPALPRRDRRACTSFRGRGWSAPPPSLRLDAPRVRAASLPIRQAPPHRAAPRAEHHPPRLGGTRRSPEVPEPVRAGTERRALVVTTVLATFAVVGMAVDVGSPYKASGDDVLRKVAAQIGSRAGPADRVVYFEVPLEHVWENRT